jgi:hypothetical protein
MCSWRAKTRRPTNLAIQSFCSSLVAIADHFAPRVRAKPPLHENWRECPKQEKFN